MAVEKKRVTPTDEQIAAWAHYGVPGVAALLSKMGKNLNPVGEVRYVIGWAADQMSRMQWLVEIDGKRDWSLKMPDGKTVKSVSKGGDFKTANANASAEVLKYISWTERIVRQVTTNLYVAGELDYAVVGDKWEVVSVIRPDRTNILAQSSKTIRGLWPHPAEPNDPDAPMFAVLPVLEEMDWLSKVSRSQSANRVSMRGIVGSADGLSFANGGEFWEEWDKALHARMDDPTDVGPLQIRGAADLVEPSGKGMKGLSWVIPEFPYDDRLDLRMQGLIQRLAYGLPIPPEVLLGLQAQSRATAFQVEENSYRAHIEPPAWLIAHIATQALGLLMPQQEVKVVPDPSLLLARRHTTQDVKEAFDRGAVSFNYLREVLGIPETAAPTQEDFEMLMRINRANAGPSATPEAGGDPADRARVGGEPSTQDRSP